MNSLGKRVRSVVVWLLAILLTWTCSEFGELRAETRGNLRPGIEKRLVEAEQYLSVFAQREPANGFPRGTSQDLLFVFAELERLADIARTNAPELETTCGPTPTALAALSNEACLQAVLLIERRQWRIAAELAARLYLKSQADLLAKLPVPRLDQNSDEANTAAATWWADYGLTGLEAIARIGREWMKVQAGNRAEQEAARVVAALNRLLREPAVSQLAVVLSQANGPVPAALAEPLALLRDTGKDPKLRLEAAQRFAVGYADLLSVSLKQIMTSGGDSDCGALLQGFAVAGVDVASICGAAFERLREFAATAQDPAALTQSLTAAFEERIITLRLLLAKLERAADAKSCGLALASMSQVTEPHRQTLDGGLLEATGTVLAKLLDTCVRDAAPVFKRVAAEWVLEFCGGAKPELTVVLTDELRIALASAWQALDSVMSVSDRKTICRPQSMDGLLSITEKQDQGLITPAARSALLAFIEISVEHLRLRQISDLRVILDQATVPTIGAPDVLLAARILCRLARGGDAAANGKHTTFDTAIAAIFLADVGLEATGEADGFCARLDGLHPGADLDALVKALADDLRSGLKVAGNPAEEIETAVSVQSARVRGALDRLKTDALDIAMRLGAAALVADVTKDQLRVDEISRNGGACTQSNATGLGLALRASGMTATVARSAVAPWHARVVGETTIVLCGANGPDALRVARTLAQLQAPFEATFPLDETLTRERISSELRGAMLSAYRNGEIRTDDLRLQFGGGIDQVLQAAAMDLGAIVALQMAASDWSQAKGLTFSKETGLSMRFRLPLANAPLPAVELCLTIPVAGNSPAPTGCDVVEDIERATAKVVSSFAGILIRPSLTSVAGRLGGDVEAALGRLAKVAPQGVYLQASFSESATARSSGMRLHVEAAALSPFLGLSGVDDQSVLTGALILAVDMNADAQSARIETVSEPDIDLRALAGRILGDIKNELLVFSKVTAEQRSDWPAWAKERCGDSAAVHVRLGAAAPVLGEIGDICLLPARDKPFFLVPRLSNRLSTPDGLWSFAYRFGDANGGPDRADVDLSLSISSHHPSFRSIESMRVAARFNLRTGDWSLPSDASENRRFYQAIERSLNAVVPRGVRIRGIRFGSEGIALSVDASQSDWIAPDKLAKLDWSNVAQATEASCDILRLHRLVQMIDTGKVQTLPPPSTCPNEDGLEGAVVLSGSTIRWGCEVAGGQLSGCQIEIPDIATSCNENLLVTIKWQGSVRNVPRSEGLEHCLKSNALVLLPKELVADVSFGIPTLAGNCADKPATCGIVVEMSLDLSRLKQQLTTAGAQLSNPLGVNAGTCMDVAGSRATFYGILTFDGATRIDVSRNTSNGSAAAVSAIADCSRALRDAVQTAALGRVAADLNFGLDKLFSVAADKARQTLEHLRQRLADAVPGPAHCQLRRNDGVNIDCAALKPDDLRAARIETITLTKALTLFEESFELTFATAWAARDLDFRGLDPSKLEDAMAEHWAGWAGKVEARAGLRCQSSQQGACLAGLGRRLAGALPAGLVDYTGGATIDSNDKSYVVRVPFQVKLPVPDVATSFVLSCTVDVSSITVPRISGCGTQVDPRTALLAALADTLGQSVLAIGKKVPLGFLTFRVTEKPAYNSAAQRLLIKGKAELDVIKIASNRAVDVIIGLGVNGRISVEGDFDGYASHLTKDLTDAVNDLIGDIAPVRITSIKTVGASLGRLPNALAIESEVKLAGLFSISAPRLLLSSKGLAISGPNRFSFTISEGLTIPVPPLAICPSGGAVEDQRLTLVAAVTLGECSATYLLNYRGSLTLNFRTPLKIESEGDLVLLSIIPLGHNEGVIDLGRPHINQRAEIGGAISSIISMKTSFEMLGNPMSVVADGGIRVFRVPIGDGHFKLNLTRGVLDTAVKANILGFAKGHGTIRTAERFSRPEANIDASLDLAGLPLVGSNIRARPRFAKAGVNFLGLKLSVAFPGLEALSPDRIAELLKNLLTPNFKDLDKALAALLRGDVTINPFAKFGSGGEGMGGDGDGEGIAGKSGDVGSDSAEGSMAGGPNDPGNGLDAQASAPQPATDALPASPVPPDGEGSGVTLNPGKVPLWFERTQDGLVAIGVGQRGTPAAARVAVANYDATHFDDGGLRKGATLSVHDHGYAQMLPGNIDGGAGCAAGPGSVVYVYTGTTVPRRGYYELCRVMGPAGALTRGAIAGLDDEMKQDLASLHGAPLSELAARPAQADHDFGRLALKARLFVSETHGLRGALIFQRPGELLIAGRGRLADKAECGTAPEVTKTPWSEPKTFWLTGVGADDLTALDKILPAVQSLWGCPNGTLARIDRTRTQLATSQTLSRWDGTAFQRAADLPVLDKSADPPSWVAPTTKVAAATAAKREQERADAEAATTLKRQLTLPSPRSICVADCKPIAIETKPANGACAIYVGDRRSGRFTLGHFVKSSCDLSSGAAWLTISPGSYATAITQEGTGSDAGKLKLGVFLDSREMALETGWLNFGDVAGLDLKRARLILSFAGDTARRGHVDQLAETRLLRDNAGTAMALVVPAGPNQFRWTVDGASARFSVDQTGAALSEEQGSALLPLLIESPRSFVRHDERHVVLELADGIWIYRWQDDNWQAIVTIATPVDGVYRPVVIDDLIGRAFAPSTTPLHARVIERHECSTGWGYALSQGSRDAALLALKRIDTAAVAFGRGPRLSPRSKAEHSSSGPKEAWFDLELPAGSGFINLNVRSSRQNWDPEVCVYDASTRVPFAYDDDGAGHLQASLDVALLDRVQTLVVRVTNYTSGATFSPSASQFRTFVRTARRRDDPTVAASRPRPSIRWPAISKFSLYRAPRWHSVVLVSYKLWPRRS